MKRKLLCTAAVTVLAASAAACASTPAPAPKAAAPALSAKNSPAAPVSTADAVHNLDTELQQAQTLRAQGNLTEATRVLAQLVLVAPDDPRIVGEYGKTLVQQGRAEDGAAFLKRATELRDTDWTVFSALGVAYDQMDDRKRAKAAYEHALTLHPGDPAVLNNYAVSRMLAGDLDGAQKLLAQAQAGGAHNPKVASNLAWLAELKAKRSAGATQSIPPGKSPRVLTAATTDAGVSSAPPAPHSEVHKSGSLAAAAAPLAQTAAPVTRSAPREAGEETAAQISGSKAPISEPPASAKQIAAAPPHPNKAGGQLPSPAATSPLPSAKGPRNILSRSEPGSLLARTGSGHAPDSAAPVQDDSGHALPGPTKKLAAQPSTKPTGLKGNPAGKPAAINTLVAGKADAKARATAKIAPAVHPAPVKTAAVSKPAPETISTRKTGAPTLRTADQGE